VSDNVVSTLAISSSLFVCVPESRCSCHKIACRPLLALLRLIISRWLLIGRSQKLGRLCQGSREGGKTRHGCSNMQFINGDADFPYHWCIAITSMSLLILQVLTIIANVGAYSPPPVFLCWRRSATQRLEQRSCSRFEMLNRASVPAVFSHVDPLSYFSTVGAFVGLTLRHQASGTRHEAQGMRHEDAN
jgi:hypothetical protein